MKRLKAKHGRGVPVAIDTLRLMVGIENHLTQQAVTDSIEEYGLLHPIIVAKVSGKEWKKEMETINPDILPPPEGDDEVFYRVQCGNQRVRAAVLLGYNHIDALIYDTKETAKGMCWTQRRLTKSWRE